MDDKDLKILALKQRIGELTTAYEDNVADLRVQLTRQEERIAQLSEPRDCEGCQGEPEVVEGEVV